MQSVVSAWKLDMNLDLFTSGLWTYETCEFQRCRKSYNELWTTVSFCNHQTNHFIDILYMSSWTQHLRAWKVWEVRNPHCSRCRSGLKIMKTSMFFYNRTELPNLFLVGMFWFFHEFLWLSNDFRLTSQTRTHPGGKMARCLFLGCFSAAPFVVFGGNSFPATSLYSAWITKREKSGLFSFPSLTAWCWWPICSDRNVNPENAWRSAFHGDLSKYVQSWDFFPGNDAASNRWLPWRMSKFRSGVAASTASNMGHHLGLWVR